MLGKFLAVTRNVSWCIIIVTLGVLITLSVSEPWVLGDSNVFLKDFVNHEYLNLLGVVLAITIASAGNLHLEFNKIEDAKKIKFLVKTRMYLKRTINILIAIFVISIPLVVAKPLLPKSDISSSLVNSAALFFVLLNALALFDISQLIFKIPPKFELDNDT